MAKALVISAPASGTGKTTLTLALARAFQYDDSDDDAPVRAISSRLEEHSRR